MATRFLPWIDNPTSSTIEGYENFLTDTERLNGFQPNTAASSLKVNTALRQANLVAAAIMDTVAPDAIYDANSSVEQVKGCFTEYFGQFMVALSYDSSAMSITATLKGGTTATLDLSSILEKTVARAVGDINGNEFQSTYATITYVTEAINNAVTVVLNTAV